VSIRVSYRDDAAYLLRLEGAVAKDDRQSDAWRRKVLHHLHAVATLFLQADVHGLGESGREHSKKVRARRLSPASAA
jgi:hypothetical protein